MIAVRGLAAEISDEAETLVKGFLLLEFAVSSATDFDGDSASTGKNVSGGSSAAFLEVAGLAVGVNAVGSGAVTVRSSAVVSSGNNGKTVSPVPVIAEVSDSSAGSSIESEKGLVPSLSWSFLTVRSSAPKNTLLSAGGAGFPGPPPGSSNDVGSPRSAPDVMAVIAAPKSLESSGVTDFSVPADDPGVLPAEFADRFATRRRSWTSRTTIVPTPIMPAAVNSFHIEFCMGIPSRAGTIQQYSTSRGAHERRMSLRSSRICQIVEVEFDTDPMIGCATGFV